MTIIEMANTLKDEIKLRVVSEHHTETLGEAFLFNGTVGEIKTAPLGSYARYIVRDIKFDMTKKTYTLMID